VGAATLTLLGLIAGFTFSMAICRYDPRKAYEETEAKLSAQNTSARTSCLPRMRRKYALTYFVLCRPQQPCAAPISPHTAQRRTRCELAVCSLSR
jgi:hypothetical protein